MGATVSVVMDDRVEQRSVALAKANEVRLARIVLRDRVSGLSQRDGCRMVAGLLRAEVLLPEFGSAPVELVLRWPRGMGAGKASRVLFEAGLGFRRALRVRDLTVRQRKCLGAVLCPWEGE